MTIKSFSSYIKEDMPKTTQQKYSSDGMQDPNSIEFKKMTNIESPDELEQREATYGREEFKELNAEKNILSSILDKAERSKNSIGELIGFLEEYGKIDYKTLEDVVSNLETFISTIEEEIKNLAK